MTEVFDNTSLGPPTNRSGGPPPFAGIVSIIILSLIFASISIVGIIGNGLVVFIIMVDRKMRNSATNILILNLAVADFIVTVFGIPDMVQFMLNNGWTIGLALCKFNRFMLVANLYASILTLVSVCVERYIAIVHPIKAHIFCEKKKVLMAICIIWPLSFLVTIYVPLYNKLHRPVPVAPQLCMTELPGDDLSKSNMKNGTAVQLYEMIVFYVLPIVLQIVLYTIVSLKLFSGHQELHADNQTSLQNGQKTQQSSETLKARKGVVMMLIACVIVYMVSYSPSQILLIYNSVAEQHAAYTWEVHVFVMVMAQLNSASNPILYCIISQKFRMCFQKYLCAVCKKVHDQRYEKTTMDSFDSRVSGRRTTLTKTITSTV